MKLGGGFTHLDHTGKLIVRDGSKLMIDSESMDLVQISIQSAFAQDIYTKNISLASFNRC